MKSFMTMIRSCFLFNCTLSSLRESHNDTHSIPCPISLWEPQLINWEKTVVHFLPTRYVVCWHNVFIILLIIVSSIFIAIPINVSNGPSSPPQSPSSHRFFTDLGQAAYLLLGMSNKVTLVYFAEYTLTQGDVATLLTSLHMQTN